MFIAICFAGSFLFAILLYLGSPGKPEPIKVTGPYRYRPATRKQIKPIEWEWDDTKLEIEE